MNQLFTLSSAIHPTGGVASFWEKETIALRDNLEMALAGLGRRASRRILLFLLLEDLGSCVNEASREEARRETYLLENLHLGLGLNTFSSFFGLGLSHAVTNANKLSINIFEPSSDAILDRLLDLSLDETRGERFQSLVQEIMLRVPDGELERSDLGVDGFNLEYRRRVLRRRHKLDRHVDALTTENEVGEAGVPELGKTSLLPEVEGNVAKVRLNLAETELNLVVGLVVDNTVRREFEIVPGSHSDDIGEQVLAREGEVFDNEVEGVVGVLNAGDGDVTDLTDDGRQNDLTDVIPQMWFELQRAFAVEEQVLCEASPVLPKPFVQRVFTHLLEPVTNGLKAKVRFTAFAARKGGHTWKRLSKWFLYLSS